MFDKGAILTAASEALELAVAVVKCDAFKTA
jgi:hypothetical protein